MIWIDFCSSPHQHLMTIFISLTLTLTSLDRRLPLTVVCAFWTFSTDTFVPPAVHSGRPEATWWEASTSPFRLQMWARFDQELQKAGINSWLRWSGWGWPEQVNGGKRRKGVQADAGSKVENRSERAGWRLGIQSLLRLRNQTEADFRNSFHSTEMCKSAAKNRKKWG